MTNDTQGELDTMENVLLAHGISPEFIAAYNQAARTTIQTVPAMNMEDVPDTNLCEALQINDSQGKPCSARDASNQSSPSSASPASTVMGEDEFVRIVSKVNHNFTEIGVSCAKDIYRALSVATAKPSLVCDEWLDGLMNEHDMNVPDNLLVAPNGFGLHKEAMRAALSKMLPYIAINEAGYRKKIAELEAARTQTPTAMPSLVGDMGECPVLEIKLYARGLLVNSSIDETLWVWAQNEILKALAKATAKQEVV